MEDCPDSKDHGANMGPTWGWPDLGGPHVGPKNLAIRVVFDVAWMGHGQHLKMDMDKIADILFRFQLNQFLVQIINVM